MKTKAERIVHLALSQKAAKVLSKIIEQMDGYHSSDEEADIADAIHADLKEQIEVKQKKKK